MPTSKPRFVSSYDAWTVSSVLRASVSCCAKCCRRSARAPVRLPRHFAGDVHERPERRRHLRPTWEVQEEARHGCGVRDREAFLNGPCASRPFRDLAWTRKFPTADPQPALSRTPASRGSSMTMDDRDVFDFSGPEMSSADRRLFIRVRLALVAGLTLRHARGGADRRPLASGRQSSRCWGRRSSPGEGLARRGREDRPPPRRRTASRCGTVSERARSHSAARYAPRWEACTPALPSPPVGRDDGGDDAAVPGPDAVALPPGRWQDRRDAPRPADRARRNGLLLRLDRGRNGRLSARRSAGDGRDAAAGAAARRTDRGRGGRPERRRAPVHRVEGASPGLLPGGTSATRNAARAELPSGAWRIKDTSRSSFSAW